MDKPTNKMNLQVVISNKQILQITLPISAAIIVPQINLITNNIFLGGVSQQALALAGVTGVYYLIFAVIGNGLNNGLQALISRRAGENRIDDIGSLFSQGVRIALVMSVLGILFTWLIAPFIFRWGLRDAAGAQMAIHFLNIRILGLPILYLYLLRNALLVGTNQSRYLIIGTAAEALSNIFFDYTLINGKWGFPRLGFDGAAYASIIAEGIGFLSILFVLHFNRNIRQLQLFRSWQFNAANTRLILTQSIPMIVQFAISIMSWEFFYILIEHHGQRDLAISNTMRNIFGFFGCFTWAFASTCNTMVSNIIGQGLQHRVPELIRKIWMLSLCFAATVCILLNLFPHLFLSVYQQGDDFIAAATPVLRIVSVAMILMSGSVVWLNAVVGTGNAKVNLYIEAMTIILYCVYVYVVLERWQLSVAWGWGSEWLYWISMFVPSYLYMKSGKWKRKRI